jgi:hypothetical protein
MLFLKIDINQFFKIIDANFTSIEDLVNSIFFQPE